MNIVLFKNLIYEKKNDDSYRTLSSNELKTVDHDLEYRVHKMHNEKIEKVKKEGKENEDKFQEYQKQEKEKAETKRTAKNFLDGIFDIVESTVKTEPPAVSSSSKTRINAQVKPQIPTAAKSPKVKRGVGKK